MSITRAQYETQIKTIQQTKVSTINSKVTTGQASEANARFDAEVVRQQAEMVQRDLLRDSGDRSPF
jgi:hypothetical protein